MKGKKGPLSIPLSILQLLPRGERGNLKENADLLDQISRFPTFKQQYNGFQTLLRNSLRLDSDDLDLMVHLLIHIAIEPECKLVAPSILNFIWKEKPQLLAEWIQRRDLPAKETLLLLSILLEEPKLAREVFTNNFSHVLEFLLANQFSSEVHLRLARSILDRLTQQPPPHLSIQDLESVGLLLQNEMSMSQSSVMDYQDRKTSARIIVNLVAMREDSSMDAMLRILESRLPNNDLEGLHRSSLILAVMEWSISHLSSDGQNKIMASALHVLLEIKESDSLDDFAFAMHPILELVLKNGNPPLPIITEILLRSLAKGQWMTSFELILPMLDVQSRCDLVHRSIPTLMNLSASPTLWKCVRLIVPFMSMDHLTSTHLISRSIENEDVFFAILDEVTRRKIFQNHSDLWMAMCRMSDHMTSSTIVTLFRQLGSWTIKRNFDEISNLASFVIDYPFSENRQLLFAGLNVLPFLEISKAFSLLTKSLPNRNENFLQLGLTSDIWEIQLETLKLLLNLTSMETILVSLNILRKTILLFSDAEEVVPMFKSFSLRIIQMYKKMWDASRDSFPPKIYAEIFLEILVPTIPSNQRTVVLTVVRDMIDMSRDLNLNLAGIISDSGCYNIIYSLEDHFDSNRHLATQILEKIIPGMSRDIMSSLAKFGLEKVVEDWLSSAQIGSSVCHVIYRNFPEIFLEILKEKFPGDFTSTAVKIQIWSELERRREFLAGFLDLNSSLYPVHGLLSFLDAIISSEFNLKIQLEKSNVSDGPSHDPASDDVPEKIFETTLAILKTCLIPMGNFPYPKDVNMSQDVISIQTSTCCWATIKAGLELLVTLVKFNLKFQVEKLKEFYVQVMLSTGHAGVVDNAIVSFRNFCQIYANFPKLKELILKTIRNQDHMTWCHSGCLPGFSLGILGMISQSSHREFSRFVDEILDLATVFEESWTMIHAFHCLHHIFRDKKLVDQIQDFQLERGMQICLSAFGHSNWEVRSGALYFYGVLLNRIQLEKFNLDEFSTKFPKFFDSALQVLSFKLKEDQWYHALSPFTLLISPRKPSHVIFKLKSVIQLQLESKSMEVRGLVGDVVVKALIHPSNFWEFWELVQLENSTFNLMHGRLYLALRMMEWTQETNSKRHLSSSTFKLKMSNLLKFLLKSLDWKLPDPIFDLVLKILGKFASPPIFDALQLDPEVFQLEKIRLQLERPTVLPSQRSQVAILISTMAFQCSPNHCLSKGTVMSTLSSLFKDGDRDVRYHSLKHVNIRGLSHEDVQVLESTLRSLIPTEMKEANPKSLNRVLRLCLSIWKDYVTLWLDIATQDLFKLWNHISTFVNGRIGNTTRGLMLNVMSCIGDRMGSVEMGNVLIERLEACTLPDESMVVKENVVIALNRSFWNLMKVVDGAHQFHLWKIFLNIFHHFPQHLVSDLIQHIEPNIPFSSFIHLPNILFHWGTTLDPEIFFGYTMQCLIGQFEKDPTPEWAQYRKSEGHSNPVEIDVASTLRWMTIACGRIQSKVAGETISHWKIRFETDFQMKDVQQLVDRSHLPMDADSFLLLWRHFLASHLVHHTTIVLKCCHLGINQV